MNPTLIIALAGAAFPTVAVLVGILINRTDTSRLSGEISTLRAEMNARMGTLGSEIHTQGDSLCAKIDAIRLQLHNDMVMLLNIGRDHEARINRLESQF